MRPRKRRSAAAAAVEAATGGPSDADECPATDAPAGNDMLMSRPSAVRARLCNDPDVSVRYTEASGDCFYEAVQQALRELGHVFVSVEMLRNVVAESLTVETFAMYSLLYQQGAEGFNFMKGINTLDQLRDKVRVVGRKVGGRNCVWADGFAMETIA